MAKSKSRFTEAFKSKTISLAHNAGRSLSSLAKELNISLTELRQWEKELAGKIKRQKLTPKAALIALALLKEKRRLIAKSSETPFWSVRLGASNSSSSASR
jgi:transposase-like protein